MRATPLVQQRGFLTNLLISFAPILLLVGFYVWMFKRQQGAMAGGLLGGGKQKRVDPETVRVTFDDVAGIDEVEAEINEVVDFLKDPEKYRRLGARAPKGVLLAGAPGTGKTLLARATAGEAKVPFFSASASEFIEMIVGVGASRVRELFSEARKVAPAIIFIDEIDTIGRARGRCASFRRSRRARTDPQSDPDGDGRFFRPRGRRCPGRHQSARRPRPGSDSTRTVRPADHHPPARPQRPRGDPEGPHAEGPSREGCGSGAAGCVDARNDWRRSREPGERGRSPGRPSQPGLGVSTRSD